MQTGPRVDLDSSREFMRQILSQITTGEMTAMARELALKGAQFQALLAPGRLESLAQADWQGLLRRSFATKRHVAELLAAPGPPGLGAALSELLYGSHEPGTRLECFSEELSAASEAWRQAALDFGSECLYLVHPGKAWLWTRWLWEPKSGVGSLRLVTLESVDLRGRGIADTYQRVGEAIAWVRDEGQREGLWPDAAQQYGADVFLACVYVVYMYTVLRMRMTREFNQVIPKLPVMARHLLGTHRMGVEGADHG